MISEEVESQAYHCNKKKKSAKTVEVHTEYSTYVHTYCFTGLMCVQELSMEMFFAIFIKVRHTT